MKKAFLRGTLTVFGIGCDAMLILDVEIHIVFVS